MRPLVGLVVLIAVAIGLAGFMSRFHTTERLASEEPEQKEEPAKPNVKFPQNDSAFPPVSEGAIRGTLEIDGKGSIGIELYPKAAPQTVAAFVKRSKQGFYEGTLFHRVLPGFVAQGGDPNSKKFKSSDLKGKTEQEAAALGLGSGGTPDRVPLEANLPHLKGTIGLARSSAPDSGSCQFYINLENNARLDGSYCVFGRVVSGMDVAEKIEMGDRIKRLSIP